MENLSFPTGVMLERVLHLSFDSVVAFVGVRDETGQLIDLRLTLLNPVAERQFGRPSDELLGRSLQWLYPGATDLFARCRTLAETNGRETFQLRLQPRGSAAPGWYEVTASGLGNALLLTQKEIPRERERLLDSLLATIPCGVQYCRAVHDGVGAVVDFQVLECNDAVCRMTGISRERFLAETLLTIDPAGRESGVFDHWKAVVDTGVSARFEHHYAAANVWFDLSVSAFGEGVLASFNDITVLKRSEQAHAREADRLQALIDAVPESISLFDLVRGGDGQVVDFRYASVNAAVRAMSGLAEDNLLGHTLLELFPGLHGDASFAGYLDAARTGQPYRASGHYAADGFDHDYETEARPLGDQLLVTFRDVTAERRAERNQLHEAERARGILDGLLIPVFVSEPRRDEEGRITDFTIREANQTALRQQGLSRTDIVGKLASEVFPKDRENGTFDRYVAVANSGQGETFEFSYPVNGHAGWLSVHLAPFGHDCVIASAIDVTALKQAETSQRETARLLRTVLDAVRYPVVAFEAVREPDEVGRVVDFRYLLVNEANAKFLNHPAADVVGRAVSEFLPQGRQNPLIAKYARVLEAGQPEVFEIDFAPHGVPGWFQVALYPEGNRLVASGFETTRLRALLERQQERTDWLQRVMDHVLTGVVYLRPVFDPAGEVVDFEYASANQQAAANVGRSPAELVGQRMLALFPGTVGVFDHLRQAYHTGQPVRYVDHYSADGLDLWGENLMVRLDDGVLYSYLDITARKRAEEQARREAERLAAVMGETQAGMVLYEAVRGADGRVVDFRYVLTNPANARVTGRTEQQLLGRTLSEHFPTLHGAEFFERLVQVTDSGEPQSYIQFYDADGICLWVEARMSRFGDGVLFTFLDVTATQEADRKLRETSELLESVLENSQTTVVVNRALRDETGEIVDFENLLLNRRAREMMGVSPGEEPGRTVFQLKPAFAQGEDFGVLKRVIETGQSAQFETAVGEATHLVTATKFGDGIVLVGVDITENRRQREQLEWANAELLRSNAELERFAYVASHDLQEPLRKISTFADRLRAKHHAQLGPDGQLYLDRMTAASHRMAQLIQNLLDYSRLTRRAGALESVDLNAVLSTVLHDLDSKIEERSAVVEVARLPTVSAVWVQMVQLFQNLAYNALKFTRSGVVPCLRISTRLAHRSELSALNLGTGRRYHCLVFEDNGIGFDPEFSEQIFVIFQRLHGRGEYEGTGIGLAIVKKIVENHGGTIVAEGRPGEGATFRVYLPE